MSEVRHLADAIHHLHDNIKIQESGLHLSCCHMDLKPENILVYIEGNAPVGVWKISDFGISSIKESVRNSEARPPKNNNNLQVPTTFADLRKRGYLTSRTARTSPKRGSGTWQAPEVHWNSGKISPQKNDVWSYGCVFVQVLACGLGGLKELVALDTKRQKGDDGKSYADDCFYRTVGEKHTINPHIERWVSALPRRSDLGISPRFLSNCSDLILSMLKIDPKDRLSAGDITEVLYKINETSTDRILSPVIHNPRDELPQMLGNDSIRRSAIPDVATHTEEPDLMAARSHIVEESLSTIDSVSGSQIETTTPHVHCAPAASLPSPLSTNAPPRRRLASIPPPTSPNFATPLPQPRGEYAQESQETIVSTNSNSRRPSIASLRCSSSPNIMRQSFGTDSMTRIVVGEQRMESQRSQQSQGAEETIDPIRRIQTDPSSISLPFMDSSSPRLGADIPYPQTPRQKSAPRASTFDPAKNGLTGSNQQSPFQPSPPWQRRTSEESQSRPSGRVSNAGTIPSQAGYSDSAALDSTNVLTFDVPRDVIQAVLSPKGSKIAFVAHSALYIYATTNQRSKYHVLPPTGHELEWQWLGASLSEGFLLTRGHSLRDRRTIVSCHPS
jgi:serine/threonine protein kinase